MIAENILIGYAVIAAVFFMIAFWVYAPTGDRTAARAMLTFWMWPAWAIATAFLLFRDVWKDADW